MLNRSHNRGNPKGEGEKNDNQMNAKIEIVEAITGLQLPKGLHWDAEHQVLYFVDLYVSKVNKYDPNLNSHTNAAVGDQPIPFIIVTENATNEFIIGYGPNVAKIIWDGESANVSNLSILARIDTNPGRRSNEGKISPSGSLFFGSHSPVNPSGNPPVLMNQAALYAFYSNGTSKVLLPNVSVSNGMQWSADNKKFYYIDSFAYRVDSFDYDINSDELTNRKTYFDLKKRNESGVPDGMCIDNDGKTWITTFENNKIFQVDPESGDVLKVLFLPAYQITSCVFAGEDLTDMYVTTGRYRMNDDTLKKYPESGKVFKITNTGVTGRASVPWKN